MASYRYAIATLKQRKGNHTIADLRYKEKDIISPSTLMFAPIKS